MTNLYKGSWATGNAMGQSINMSCSILFSLNQKKYNISTDQVYGYHGTKLILINY